MLSKVKHHLPLLYYRPESTSTERTLRTVQVRTLQAGARVGAGATARRIRSTSTAIYVLSFKLTSQLVLPVRLSRNQYLPDTNSPGTLPGGRRSFLTICIK